MNHNHPNLIIKLYVSCVRGSISSNWYVVWIISWWWSSMECNIFVIRENPQFPIADEFVIVRSWMHAPIDYIHMMCAWHAHRRCIYRCIFTCQHAVRFPANWLFIRLKILLLFGYVTRLSYMPFWTAPKGSNRQHVPCTVPSCCSYVYHALCVENDTPCSLCVFCQFVYKLY